MDEHSFFNVNKQAFVNRLNPEKNSDAKAGWDWDKNLEKGFDLNMSSRDFGIMMCALHEIVTPLIGKEKFRVTVIGDPEKEKIRFEYRCD